MISLILKLFKTKEKYTLIHTYMHIYIIKYICKYIEKQSERYSQLMIVAMFEKETQIRASDT